MSQLKDHIFNERNPKFSLCERYWFGTEPNKRLTKEPTVFVCGHCHKKWKEYRNMKIRAMADRIIAKVGTKAFLDELRKDIK